jgi:hypothetical protein
MEVHPVEGRSMEQLRTRIESWGMRVTWRDLLVARRE